MKTQAFDETGRLQALYELQVLHTPHEEAFDDFVSLASQLCDAPISLISLIGAEYLWFKARCGIDLESMPRNEGFCEHALARDDLLEVPDARLDPRFADFASVTGTPHLRFYAGMPLHGSTGYGYGTLCVLDTRPRELTDRQRDGLRRLAKRVVESLELRKNQVITQSREAAITELLEVIPDAVVTCDAAGNLKEFNAAARDWHGVDPRACKEDEWAKHFGLYDKNGTALLQPDQIPLAKAWRGERVRSQMIVIRTNGKDSRTVSCNANPLLDAQGRILGAVCSMHDVTVQTRLARMMEKIALTDELTGLPNRTAWFAELDQTIAHSQRSGSPVVVLFIDLDGFKQINDSLGHATGDEVLRQFGARLRNSCRRSDFVARLGGDEFVVCMSRLGREPIDPVKIAQKIHDAMAPPFIVHDQEMQIGCSVGVAVENGPNFNMNGLMVAADIAMYEAKRAPRPRVPDHPAKRV